MRYTISNQATKTQDDNGEDVRSETSGGARSRYPLGDLVAVGPSRDNDSVNKAESTLRVATKRLGAVNKNIHRNERIKRMARKRASGGNYVRADLRCS